MRTQPSQPHPGSPGWRGGLSPSAVAAGALGIPDLAAGRPPAKAVRRPIFSPRSNAMRGFDDIDKRMNATRRLVMAWSIVATLIGLAMTGVIIWAIVACVRHFTG